MKHIELIVSPTGETRLETKGFQGADCQHASKFIEQALGKRAGEQLTGEFFLPAGSVQLHVGGPLT